MMDEHNTSTKRRSSSPPSGGESNKIAAVDAGGKPSEANEVKIKLEDEYEADTDEDVDERKPPAKDDGCEAGIAIKQEDEYGAETDDDADDGGGKEKPSGEEEEPDIVMMKSFPRGCHSYRIVRVSGHDVLQHVEEVHAEGLLEIDLSSGGKSAKFWVELPGNHGGIAGRIDAGSFEGTPPTFFRAVASKACIDYGMWNGPVYRNGVMPGALFGGTTVVTGTHFAVAGNTGFTKRNPLHIGTIYAFDVKRDEPSSQQPKGKGSDDKDHLLKAGDIGFTLFLDAGDEPDYRPSDLVPVEIPVELWFRPLEPSDEADSAVEIPPDVCRDIDKLPQFSQDWKNEVLELVD